MANQQEISGAIDILDNVAAQTAMGRNDHARASNAIQLLKGFATAVFAGASAKVSDAKPEEPGNAESSTHASND